MPLFLSMLRSETAASPDRLTAALTGLHVYQQAERAPAPPPLPAERRHGRARLTGTGGAGRPVVLVPSLINPAAILDLSEEVSLLRALGAAGMQAWLLDWGTPSSDERAMDVGDHVRDLLLPLIEQLDAPPVLVGYCMGGTMAWAAASLTPVAAVATIAAPWRFAGYGAARPTMAEHWESARAACDTLGLVPMEVLQAGFWRLDPQRTVDKYIAFGRLAPDCAAACAFVRLEDWANAGAPLTFAAGRELFDDLIARDLPGNGSWFGDPRRLPCPTVEFVSTTDRIVPAATAAGLADRRELSAGHVGMVIGRGRMTLWRPLIDWITALPATR
ncbi:alpha/beta fold hydrolase [Sphingomonas sp. KR1UV-12]|uniref:Alpha/beta fold hydrolase n=1 Tax=Sphingomonas aurea TaxID=3063994 RepID=A0ABT9EFI9_9SPHN|nr:alpha/beta fold hydrolase [Sphingomonas sp. KR1UV-12]MDP1025734.1 alpha/beta fold hydrolase [Sphingomonas sp. KR1UV-12]